MRISTLELDKRLAMLEARLNSKTYDYCLCFDESLGGNLRMDKGTGIIEQYDGEAPIDNKPFIILFPELLIYNLTHGDTLDSLNPFERWYLQQAFETTNDEILIKRINKLQKQWDKAEQDRRDKLEERPKSNLESFPEADLSQYKPPQVKAYDKAARSKVETEEEHLRKVMQTRLDIEEEFGNNHIETLF